jgi:hypothetical protein
MSQRSGLFNAGYSVVAPLPYFNQLALIDRCSASDNLVIKSMVQEMKDEMAVLNSSREKHLQAASELALHFNIPTPALPGTPAEYIGWKNQYIEAVEERFPMSRIDFYYFFYGRKLSEILCNVDQLRRIAGYSAEVADGLDLWKKADDCFKDSQYIIFKLIAAAALLSSEPRHNYFNVYYKQFSHEFEQFSSTDLKALTEDGKKALVTNLESYQAMLLEGYHKCVSLLLELGI